MKANQAYDERVAAKSFRDLLVWQKAHQLVLAVYRLTDDFPKHELFALTSQIRRAAFSVPANIAEGFRRRGLKDKICIFNIAESSLEEAHYYLILDKTCHYGLTSGLIEQANEVDRMLEAYCNAIRTAIEKGSVLTVSTSSASHFPLPIKNILAPNFQLLAPQNHARD